MWYWTGGDRVPTLNRRRPLVSDVDVEAANRISAGRRGQEALTSRHGVSGVFPPRANSLNRIPGEARGRGRNLPTLVLTLNATALILARGELRQEATTSHHT